MTKLMKFLNATILLCMTLLTIKLYSAPTLDETPASSDDVQLDRMEEGQTIRSLLIEASEKIRELDRWQRLGPLAGLQNSLRTSRESEKIVSLLSHLDSSTLLGIPGTQLEALKNIVIQRKKSLKRKYFFARCSDAFSLISFIANTFNNLYDCSAGTIYGNISDDDCGYYKCAASTGLFTSITLPLVLGFRAYADNLHYQIHKCDNAFKILDGISKLQFEHSFPDISHLTQSDNT